MGHTGYESYSQAELHSLFSTNTWRNLDIYHRLNACQEVENRYASEHGVSACTVRTVPVDGAYYGWHRGDSIYINTHLLERGEFVASYEDVDGSTCYDSMAVPAAGWNVLDTVYHEGTHGIQAEEGRIPNTYINCSTDPDLYRIQGIEKEAFAVGQTRTLDAIHDSEQLTGELDPERNEYFDTVRSDSFDKAQANAQYHYGDANIEDTLNQVISDRDNGIIRTNQSESYESINNLCDRQYSYGLSRDGLTNDTASYSADGYESSHYDVGHEQSSYYGM